MNSTTIIIGTMIYVIFIAKRPAFNINKKNASINQAIFSEDAFLLNNINIKNINIKNPTMYHAPNISVPLPVLPNINSNNPIF